MKILHICLCGPYNDNWTYQENLLSMQNKFDGHDVTILTTTFINDINSNHYKKVGTSDYIDVNGLRIIRINKKRCISSKINTKVRTFHNTYKWIEKIDPDLIFVHGLQFYDLKCVGKYVSKHPAVIAYADNHADAFNSARGYISKKIIHGLFYKHLIHQNLKYFKKLFYIAKECKDFLIEEYGIDENNPKLEFLTLGGVLPKDEEYNSSRKIFRKENMSNTIMFLHTGKMSLEKGTLDTLHSFHECKNESARLFLAGAFDKNIESKCYQYIEKDKRIQYLGWLDNKSLKDAMCGCDVLIQPKSRSVSYQTAICCRMATILEENKNNKFLVSNENGIILKEGLSLSDAIQHYLKLKTLEDAKKKAYEFAINELDYRNIAARLYER